MKFGTALGAITLACATVSCSTPVAATQRLDVRAMTGDAGTQQLIPVTVRVGPTVQHQAAAWVPRRNGAGCDSDGSTLVLRSVKAHRDVQVGEACSWADEDGPTSPDGRFLVAWKPRDGAAARIHLIDLKPTPADVGEVPHSQSANYSAAWTRDGRLWFTYDATTDGDDEVWSYQPGNIRAQPTVVRGAVLVLGVESA